MYFWYLFLISLGVLTIMFISGTYYCFPLNVRAVNLYLTMTCLKNKPKKTMLTCCVLPVCWITYSELKTDFSNSSSLRRHNVHFL